MRKYCEFSSGKFSWYHFFSLLQFYYYYSFNPAFYNAFLLVLFLLNSFVYFDYRLYEHNTGLSTNFNEFLQHFNHSQFHVPYSALHTVI